MFRCSRCFAVVNELVWSIFGVPQGMSLAGAINVSTWSMFRCSRYVIARNFFISGRNLTYDSLFQSFVQSLIFRQGYCKNNLSYQNILYCVWKLTLSATTSYKNNCNTVNGLWDICAERSAIALIIYFSRNIAKTIYRIITFLDSFESWHGQATRLITHRRYPCTEATTVRCGSMPQCLRSHRYGLCWFL